MLSMSLKVEDKRICHVFTEDDMEFDDHCIIVAAIEKLEKNIIDLLKSIKLYEE